MPQLKVIRASAGSGKTFALTGAYLRLLFAETDYFEHILAVTFTNRATNEMKERIVRELDRLSRNLPSGQLDGIMKATGLGERQVRLKAAIILKKLLHRYASFSVSTIDAFFQRIIRSFTRELGLQGMYSIELDTEVALTAAIDQLMLEAEKDPSLAAWLVSYAESLIERGENWNFRKSMQILGKEIFREEFRSLARHDAHGIPDRKFLKEYRQSLYALRKRLEQEYREFGIRAGSLLESAGFQVDDFSNKSRGPAGFLVKLVYGYREPTATAIQAAEQPEKWFAKNAPRAAEIRALAERELMPLMQQVVHHYEAHHREYHTLEVVLKNLFTLGILSDLATLTDRWCNENNAFLLPEAPEFLHRIIDNNDTPFIYEKAGYWYHHFMIDEFQDTSLLQWANFKPLISNSLSQDYDNLLVGDVKQSIYRWRNSNWSILAGGIESDFPAGVLSRSELSHNWRSGRNIIDFNNRFFSTAAAILEADFQAQLQADGLPEDAFGNRPVTGIYGDLHQEPGVPGNEGHVEIVVLPGEKEAYEEAVFSDLRNRLSRLFEAGYNPSDIAIITRKNREARQVAEYLLDPAREAEGFRRVDVISDEALRLGSSRVVTFLLSLLTYISDNRDRNAAWFVLAFLLGNENETSLPDTDTASRMERLNLLLPPGFAELNASRDGISLPEMVERLIMMFHLGQYRGEQVYLNALRDMAGDYTNRHASSLEGFLEWWEETGKNKSVSAPEGQDALRILTIHKAKGLEFDVVILPFVTWELNTAYNTILWCKTEQPPFDRLKSVPVYYNGSLKKTWFVRDYYQEMLSQYIDNLNLLYVAFTRAAKSLMVYCRDGGDGLKNTSDLTRSVMSQVFGSGVNFETGSLPVPRSKPIPVSSPMPGNEGLTLDQVTGRIRIAFPGTLLLDPAVGKPRRPVNEGRILHEIFSLIHHTGDEKAAVEQITLRGMISRKEEAEYLRRITHLMNDIQVMSWFGRDWEVVNEAEMILPGGQIRRPDRVMIMDRRALVVDYKFGEKDDPGYHRQVVQYCELLQQMGYERVEGYLWYALSGKVLQVFRQGG